MFLNCASCHVLIDISRRRNQHVVITAWPFYKSWHSSTSARNNFSCSELATGLLMWCQNIITCAALSCKYALVGWACYILSCRTLADRVWAALRAKTCLSPGQRVHQHCLNLYCIQKYKQHQGMNITQLKLNTFPKELQINVTRYYQLSYQRKTIPDTQY